MHQGSAFAAAIFDMDGLLFDTETLGRQAWTQALAESGYSLSERLYLSLVGRDMAWRERLLIAHFGPQLPFARIKARRLELGEEQELGQGLPLKPGAAELLRALHRLGVPLALATGTERARAGRRLRQVQLLDCFAHIVTSEDVPQGKPAPDIFLAAAARLGVPPARCLVFEDACAGVSAAAAAGCAVVMVPDLESPGSVASLASDILPSLADALPLLPRWFGPCGCCH